MDKKIGYLAVVCGKCGQTLNHYELNFDHHPYVDCAVHLTFRRKLELQLIKPITFTKNILLWVVKKLDPEEHKKLIEYEQKARKEK